MIGVCLECGWTVVLDGRIVAEFPTEAAACRYADKHLPTRASVEPFDRGAGDRTGPPDEPDVVALAEGYRS